MTRERAKELLPVIQAYAEGKEIEVTFDGGKKWEMILEETEFKLSAENYRIKPEPKYRPFRDCDELIAHWQKMMGYPTKPNTMPLIWVKWGENANDISFQINGFDRTDNIIKVGAEYFDLKNAFNEFVFLDGTPFGVAE